MKNRKIIFSIMLYFVLIAVNIYAQLPQNLDNSIIRKAMKDELGRNYSRLKLENLAPPFFIAYSMQTSKSLEIKSVLGSILSSNEYPSRSFNVKVLVGDYQLNDDNFYDLNQVYSSGNYVQSVIPSEDDYNGIRRAFWLTTDNVYKKAAEKFERKKAAMKQQTVSPELLSLADLSKITPVTYTEELKPNTFDKSKWEAIANEISAVLINFPEVYASETSISLHTGEEYYITTEGTEIIKPINFSSVYVNAYTQAADGEELTDNVICYSLTPEGLPLKEEIIEKVKKLGERLTALRNAPVLKETYNGPVMFEGLAASEFFAQRFFRTSSGLLASRKPIVGDQRVSSYLNQQSGESLENYIDRRIISKDVTVKAQPYLNKFGDTNLIGCYKIDEEGVKPPEEIILIQKGILKTLLNNRTPSPKIKESNGHQRPFGEGGFSAGVGASVININAENGLTDDEIKAKLIQMAKDEGLEYAILIRKIKPLISGKYPKFSAVSQSYGSTAPKKIENPLYVYRIYVKDGREELLRSADIQDVSISALKHIAVLSKNQIAFNILMPQINTFNDWGSNGYPASFITPSSLILEELELKNAKQDYTPKPPVSPPPSRK